MCVSLNSSRLLHTPSQLISVSTHIPVLNAWQEWRVVLWLSFSELWFGLGKRDHHRWRDPLIQRVLTGQHQLHRAAPGIRRQTPAGVLPSFPYARGSQQRWLWLGEGTRGESSFSHRHSEWGCREKPGAGRGWAAVCWRWGDRSSGDANSPVLCVGRSPRMPGNPDILGCRCWPRHSSSGNPSVCSLHVPAVPLCPEASLRW